MVTLERLILERSTIRQLKADAKEVKIPKYSRLTKAELIDRLEAAELWQQESHPDRTNCIDIIRYHYFPAIGGCVMDYEDTTETNTSGNDSTYQERDGQRQR